ncbi:dynein intermediate chain 3, ciliary-like [Cydia pomonella]|uniref:dynein intermediate chain 3, ciliary-like n=1 Tax=Cydia pomonella TaxID=82600 RepID=UPI002ADD941C|nr:dynein intermediate chain 3, ciliary-like [Cydia pomonella]
MPFRYFKSSYEYTKKRKDFGRQPLFTSVPGHLLDSINPDKVQQKLYCLRNPVHVSVQATLPQSQHDANTKQVLFNDQGMNHKEGGWPREVHPDHEELVLRHCRRVTHEENYIHAVDSLSKQMVHCINQNNAINLYESYFSDMLAQEPVETYHIREQNVFRDSWNRPVSCVCWTHEQEPKLAVAYAYKQWVSDTKPDIETVCYIWNVTNQSTPEHEIIPDVPCCQLLCSPVDPQVLVGGLNNGTVNVFDIRSGKISVSSSSVFNSHFAPVSAMRYTTSRTNTEIFTGSPDGCCYWWDLRDLSKPLDQLIMTLNLAPGEQPQLTTAEAISSLDFNAGFPTKFLSGTDSGLVITVNRMGRSHGEVMAAIFKAHLGAVRTVQRSPCTARMFVTCGDYTVQVWSEEVRSAPIIITKPYRYQVSDVAWAPFRYSSYMSVCQGGYMYYWDFLRKYKEPVASLKLSKYGLTKVSPHEGGHLIAAGDTNGSTYLTTIPENMVVPGKDDKHLMGLLYERETRREHNLEARQREINLKLRLQEQHEQAPTSPKPEDEEDEEAETAAEEEYFRIVNEELSKMEDAATGTLL